MKKKKLLTLLTGILVILFCGCGEKKYNVDYHGQKSRFEHAKDSYEAGTEVRLQFGQIASDTDYYFYVDGKEITAKWENEGYVIEFTMPAHDIEVYYKSVNSMYMMLPYESEQDAHEEEIQSEQQREESEISSDQYPEGKMPIDSTN